MAIDKGSQQNSLPPGHRGHEGSQEGVGGPQASEESQTKRRHEGRRADPSGEESVWKQKEGEEEYAEDSNNDVQREVGRLGLMALSSLSDAISPAQ